MQHEGGAPSRLSERSLEFANGIDTPKKKPQYGLGGRKPASGSLSGQRQSLTGGPMRVYGGQKDFRGDNARPLLPRPRATGPNYTTAAPVQAPPRSKITVGASITGTPQHGVDTPYSIPVRRTSSSQPLKAPPVPVRGRRPTSAGAAESRIKRKAAASDVIDIAEDSDAEPPRHNNKNLSTLIEAVSVSGRGVPSAQVHSSSPRRRQYQARGVLINDSFFKGSATVIFDAKDNSFDLRLPKKVKRGLTGAHEPISVPFSELEKICMCDGGSGVGKFVVLQASRDVDGVRSLGLDSNEKDRFTIFMKEADYGRFHEEQRTRNKLPVKIEERDRGDPTCQEYLRAAPELGFQDETPKPPVATPSKRPRRTPKQTQEIEYVFGSESESEVEMASKRSRARDDEADKLFLRYPVHETAQDVISIVVGDLSRLSPEEYLNDSLIDFALRTMVAPSGAAMSDRVHVFSCLFYSKMLESKRARGQAARDQEAYRLVSKWSRGVDIFSKDFIFVPINENMHWSLSVIVRPGASSDEPGNRPCILYLDSMAMHNTNKIHRFLLNYLQCEWNAQGRPEREFNKQNVPAIKPKVPQQQNGFDCGVYTIIFAERIFDKMMPSREEDIRSRFKEYDLNENVNQQEVDVKRTTIRSLLDKVKKEWDEEQQMQADIQRINAQELEQSLLSREADQPSQEQTQPQEGVQEGAALHQPPMDIAPSEEEDGQEEEAAEEETTHSISAESES